MSDDSASLEFEDPSIVEFIFLASHGLRSPITAIRWGLEMLKKHNPDSLDETQKDMLHDVHRNACELSTLLRSLISLSRIDQGKQDVILKQIDIPDIVSTIIDDYRPWLSARDIEIAFTTPDSISAPADMLLFSNLIRHLLTACLEAMPEGGVCSIAITHDEEEVTIECTGDFVLPILQDHANRVKQYHIVGGTPGLLLYMIRRLAKAIDWHFAIEDKGEGHISSMKLYR